MEKERRKTKEPTKMQVQPNPERKNNLKKKEFYSRLLLLAQCCSFKHSGRIFNHTLIKIEQAVDSNPRSSVIAVQTT